MLDWMHQYRAQQHMSFWIFLLLILRQFELHSSACSSFLTDCLSVQRYNMLLLFILSLPFEFVRSVVPFVIFILCFIVRSVRLTAYQYSSSHVDVLIVWTPSALHESKEVFFCFDFAVDGTYRVVD